MHFGKFMDQHENMEKCDGMLVIKGKASLWTLLICVGWSCLGFE